MPLAGLVFEVHTGRHVVVKRSDLYSSASGKCCQLESGKNQMAIGLRAILPDLGQMRYMLLQRITSLLTSLAIPTMPAIGLLAQIVDARG